MTDETDDPGWFEDVNEAFPQDNDYPVDRDDHFGPVARVYMVGGAKEIDRMRDLGWEVHDVEAVNAAGYLDILFQKQ